MYTGKGKGCYGVVPNGLPFLGFLGNAEFSPREILSELTELWKSQKKFAGVFLAASDNFFVLFCLEKIVCALLIRMMKDKY